jgi:membrane protease subunit (stomatin/prohibitin family)
MALMDFIKKQFVDVIHWTEDGDGILAMRYPMQDMEIQYGAQLTVRESQIAVFVNEGQVADVFSPGRYRLTTRTLPVLTYLKNWDKLFESPFKSEVYFLSTRLQLDRKWGTSNPITIRDQDFGMVRMRAFGIYSYQLSDAKKFYSEISGTRAEYTVEDLDGQLRNLVISSMTDLFGESGVPFIDMAANQDELSRALKGKLEAVFERYGLLLDRLVVQNVSLPEELQKVLDTRIGMNMIGDLGRYTQYQVASSIPLAAQNEGGIAGHRRRSRCGARHWPGNEHGDGIGHAGGGGAGGAAGSGRCFAAGRCGADASVSAQRRRGGGDAGEAARAGRQGDPFAGRIRRQEGGIAR